MTVTTCGIFIITKDTKQILACHATNSYWSMLSIPKGLCEINESYLDCAIRELNEETSIDISSLGLTKDDIKYIGSAKYKKQNKILQGFLLEIPTLIPINQLKCTSLVTNYRGKPPFPEIDSFFWLNLDDAIIKLHESQAELLIGFLNKK
jgi:8-oxo-dGTP pyrophosphatase MutT (NUDIX family)